jgi:hypothetical protein
MIGGVRFDGAETALDVGHATAFQLVGSMTVSAWIRPPHTRSTTQPSYRIFQTTLAALSSCNWTPRSTEAHTNNRLQISGYVRQSDGAVWLECVVRESVVSRGRRLMLERAR